MSVACALLTLTCALGLLASIAKTFATQGQALLAACTLGSPELLALASNCPFDPTRIYVSTASGGGYGRGCPQTPLGGVGKVPGPCAVDPTHCSPQSSSLCLWGISLVLCVAETVFAVRCAQFSHQLLGLRPWCGKSYPLSVRPSPHYSPKSLISLEARLPLHLLDRAPILQME